MSNSISTSRFTCSLCTRSRSYKTQRGLKRHETIKHKDHNILSLHIYCHYLTMSLIILKKL